MKPEDPNSYMAKRKAAEEIAQKRHSALTIATSASGTLDRFREALQRILEAHEEKQKQILEDLSAVKDHIAGLDEKDLAAAKKGVSSVLLGIQFPHAVLDESELTDIAGSYAEMELIDRDRERDKERVIRAEGAATRRIWIQAAANAVSALIGALLGVLLGFFGMAP